MLQYFAQFLEGIIKFAEKDSLAAVLILLIVAGLIVAAGVFLLAKLWIQVQKERAEKQAIEARKAQEQEEQKKREANFIYTSGLMNNLEINIRKMLDEKDPCYFIGSEGESRRAALFDIKNRLGQLEKDIDEIKQVTVLSRGKTC